MVPSLRTSTSTRIRDFIPGNKMEKYGNKNPLMKFVHKNTGYIICGIILVIAIPLYLNETNSQEFFEKWTCSSLQSYLLTYDQDIYKRDFPDHEHLSEQQHIRLHEVVAECNFEGVFEHK